MTDYQKILDGINERESRRAARQALLNDGATGAIDINGAATASVIANTPHPAAHMGQWEQMSRVEQGINALEANWHNRQKSQTYAEFVDAVESADAGYASRTGDIDGTDEESQKAVADLLSKDTKVNAQYKQQQLERARKAYGDYKALEADDYQYHTPQDIQRMMEATKGKGLWEGGIAGAKELLSGDILGTGIYLAGSLGAVAPELVLGALGGAAGNVAGGARLANAVRAITMAYGSYENSYGSKMADMLKERGIDVGDFEKTAKAIAERGAEIDDLKYRSKNYATGVALFDAVSGYAAGLKLTPSELVRKVGVDLKKSKSLTARLGGEFANIGTQSGVQGVLGGAGEALGTLAAGEEIDAGEVLLEMLGEFTTAPIEVLQAGVSTTTNFRKDMARTELAEAEAQLMENVVKVSEATAAALGNEETVVKWAERLGQGKVVHAFAQDLVVNGEMEKLQAVDPELAEQVKQAAEEGTTVTMPVGKIAEIAVKDNALAQEMVKDVRLSVDGMSPRQAEEFKKTGFEETTKKFDKALKKTKATVQQFQSAHKVAQRLKDELITAGTDKYVAAAQVKPVEMYLARRAAQLGIDPEAIAKEINLRVAKDGVFSSIGFDETRSESILTGNPALDREVKNWARLVDGLKTRPNAPVRMLSQTPAILEMLGAKYKGVFVPKHFFAGALQAEALDNPKHHLHLNITKNILKQIPAALTNPIAVFHNKGDGRYVFMLEIVDDNGATVITPIEFEADYHGASLTMALSAYAKNHELDKAYEGKSDAEKLTPKDRWFVSNVLHGATPVYVNRPKFQAWAEERNLPDPTKNKVMMSKAKTEEDWAQYKADYNKLYSRLSPSITGKAAIKKGLARDSRYVYQPPSLEKMKQNQEQFETNLKFVADAVGMRGLVKGLTDPNEIAEAVIDRMAENLLWIHDRMNASTRDRAKLWYDGAHRAAVAWANRYGIHVRQAAAAIAIFSPQTNWFNNMSCAERTMDIIFGERGTKANEPMFPLLESYCTGKDAFRLEDLKTKTLGELIKAGDLRTVALWCKAFDIANRDQKIRVQTPEGGVGGWYDKGNRVWLGVDRQATAISVLLDGSVDNIDYQIGGKFKVRDFYNNIFDPSNPEAATIDTHAVGAGLFNVMSGKDIDVNANFGTQKGVMNSLETGQIGTYAFHYEALKRAAEKRGLLPREMQSITWEGIRSLFGQTAKKGLRPKVNAVWERHENGDITAEEAREEIFKIAGGFDPISWDNEETPYNDEVQDSYDRSGVNLPELTPPALEPTLAIEAAPNPNDAVAVAQWNRLTDEEKFDVTQAVVEDVMVLASEYEQARTGEYGLQVGGWMGDVNYSMAAKVYDPNKAVRFASLVARLLRQEAVMVISGEEGEGMFKAGVIQIRLPDGFTPEQVEHLYKEGIDKAGAGRLVKGMSTSNGIMNIVLDEGDDGAKIVKAIQERLTSEDFASHHFDIFYEDAFAAFATPTEIQDDSNDSQEASRLGTSSQLDGIRALQGQVDQLFADHLARATQERTLRQAVENARNAEEVALHQSAYSGGAVQHAKFSTDFIGTGEGNRAWGWGLYFAKLKDIAEFYRNMITASKSVVKINGREYERGSFFDNSIAEHAIYEAVARRITKLGDKLTEEQLKEIKSEAIKSIREEYSESNVDKDIDEVQSLSVDDIVIEKDSDGRTFKVEIPEMDELLDMQKPLDEQPPKVQEAIKKITEVILEKDRQTVERREHFVQGGAKSVIDSALADIELPENVDTDALVSAGEEYIRAYQEAYFTNSTERAKNIAHHSAVVQLAKSLMAGGVKELDAIDAHINLLKLAEEDATFPLWIFADSTLSTVNSLKSSGIESATDGRDFYSKLTDALDSDEAASRMLNKYGVKGNTYVGERDGRCFVIFDDDAVQIVDYWQGEQGNRGAYVPKNTGTNTLGSSGLITLMENADKSTFMHESAHFFLDLDTLLASRLAEKYGRGEELTEGEKEFLTSLGGFFQWGQREGVIDLGVTDDIESVMRAAKAWAELSTNEQRAMHELFAEGFESYLMTGEAPSNSVRKLFNDFKNWLIDVYATVTKKPRPISKDVKKLYDLMFATAQEVQEVETANGMIPLFNLEDQREEEEAKQKSVKLSKEAKAEMRKLHKEAQLEAQGIVTKSIAGVVNYYVKLRDSAAKKIAKEHKAKVNARIEALLEEPRYVAYDILTNGLIRDGQKLKFKLSPESLRAEGYDQATIDALTEKGLTYGRERQGLLSPKRLADMVGEENVEQLMTDLAEGTRAKPRSPLAKARELLGSSGGEKLSVRELKAAGIKDDVIAKLIERNAAYDSSLRADTVNSQVLAEMAGHDSAVDLIAELVDIQEPRIEAASQVAAQIQMETGETPEVYTDLQANLAAHNKARGRFLTAEYNAIAEMLGQRRVAVYAAREYAKTKLQGVKMKDVRSAAYIAAERRCARDAERAFIKGDYQACLDAKRGQILNHELARQALEIEEKMLKAERAARKALKSKGLYKPYQRLLARFVSAHELTSVSDKLLRQQDDVDALVKELEEDGTPIEGLAQGLVDKTPVKEMTVAEAEAYLAAVKELTAIARNRQTQNLMATKARISDIIDEGETLLNNAADAQGQGDQRMEVPKSFWEKAAEGAKNFFFGHIKVQTMCRIFDQNKDNGFFWNLFIRSANKCADFEDSERAKTAAKLDEILRPLFGKKGAFDVDKQRIGNKMMSKGERFAAACNMGNESNLKRLIDGDKNQWTNENLLALQQSLTADEWLAVQKVWDLLESYRPLIAEKQKRVYGEEPEWIEPKELTVQTADGQMLTLRGGYYPVKYDPYGSDKAARQDDAKAAAQELRGAFQSATTNRSFVKSRVPNPNVGPLRLDMAALFSGLNDVIHDLAWHEWLIETRRVLVGVNGEGSGLRAVIKERYGKQAADLFEQWRTHIAEGDRIDSSPIWKYLAGKAGVSLMGWSPMSAIVQLTGIGYIVPRCGAKSTFKALAMFLKNPMETRRAINDVSSLMKNRALTSNRHVAEIRSKLDSGNDPWYKKYAYSMLLSVQSIADTVCWLAAYDKAMRDVNVLATLDPDATAVAIADQAVIDTQSSGRISDSADFENEGNLKALTVFYTWANAALNQSYGIYKGEQDRLAAFQKLVWMGLVMPTIEKIFRDILRPDAEGDDEDEFDVKDLFQVPLGASLEYHLGLFVGLREMANAAGGVVAGEPAFAYNGPAGTRGAAAGTKLLQSASSLGTGNGWAMVTAGIDAAGALTGIPSAQINRTIKGLRAIESGQAEGMDALLAPVFGYSGRIKE